ncbi:hypothetical protein EPA93_43310 [Ktedonosporobacter rubrisoli]|uniref:Uncharacterized protein n=1 Tax=Ktedonosporobacter rubrisoli TaxID=2509675 RepID=A0A4P6K334_KTERU|nr:hypothetical protein [Ktedonosporobacter rubrisoli]QBD82445.1 hypothetical protein EPA93_43310 [Ktedonosporobacter rubrisoli]
MKMREDVPPPLGPIFHNWVLEAWRPTEEPVQVTWTTFNQIEQAYASLYGKIRDRQLLFKQVQVLLEDIPRPKEIFLPYNKALPALPPELHNWVVYMLRPDQRTTLPLPKYLEEARKAYVELYGREPKNIVEFNRQISNILTSTYRSQSFTHATEAKLPIAPLPKELREWIYAAYRPHEEQRFLTLHRFEEIVKKHRDLYGKDPKDLLSFIQQCRKEFPQPVKHQVEEHPRKFITRDRDPSRDPFDRGGRL